MKFNHWLKFVALALAAMVALLKLNADTQEIQCVQPTVGLVAWWPGDGHILDLVNGNNGRLTGATYAPGLVERAFSFDGSGGVVEIPDAPRQKPPNLTVEAWVQFAASDTRWASAPGLQYIVFKRNTRYDLFEGYTLLKTRASGVDRLAFAITSASGNTVANLSTNQVVNGHWYHIAGTYDGSATRLYVNGVMEDSHPARFALDYGRRPLFLGGSGETFWVGNLNGMVDEVSLYNRALSASEIAAIYRAGSAGKCKPPPRIAAKPNK